MIFNFISKEPSHVSLDDLDHGSRAVVHDFRLSDAVADHLMNLGFVPGVEVEVTRSGPGGDPRVYRVDGTEVALRREVSQNIVVRPLVADGASA